MGEKFATWKDIGVLNYFSFSNIYFLLRTKQKYTNINKYSFVTYRYFHKKYL